MVAKCSNNSGDSKDRVNLDEILKSLFNVSKKVLIDMMNSLFDEDYEVAQTEISFENNEFVSDEYDIIRGDLFLKISRNEKPYHYHIELQTKNDASMIIRMFEYGFNKAKEFSKYEDEKETIIYIPKQLVIFIEENRNIADELRMKLVFPDDQQIRYKVSVMKYWKYDDKKLIEKKMYPLLPLQVFKLRYRMEKIKRQGQDNQNKLKKIILKAKNTAEKIAKEARNLYEKEEITGEDFHKVLLAIDNLFKYLNRKYGDNKNLEEEVYVMTKTLYDPVVEEKAKIQGKKEGKKEGIKEGKKEELIETVKIQLEKKFNTELSANIKEGIKTADIDSLAKIRDNIFDIGSLEEVKKILGV